MDGLSHRLWLHPHPFYALPLARGQVAAALEALQRISLIVHGHRRGAYTLVEPMFGAWYLRQATR